MLSKILANCISGVITTLIHADQVGFTCNRFASVNIRRLINVMWTVRNNSTPMAAISLNAEKARLCRVAIPLSTARDLWFWANVHKVGEAII